MTVTPVEVSKEDYPRDKYKMPLVSIIMSEYNTPKELLIESIKSMINQSYTNFELLLIDDCGNTNVDEVVREINDNRIIVIKNPQNMGLVKSLNKGLNYAKGKYIIRMDTDDFSYPNRIEKQVEFIEKHPEYSVVSSNIDFYDGEKIFANTKFSGEVTKEIALSGGTPIAHPSVIARRDDLLSVAGGEYPDYKRCEDYALWLELLINGYRLFVMNDILLRYHLSESDYAKRTLRTRKDYFRLLKEKYIKLNPTKLQYCKVVLKTCIAGLMPYKLMAYYHRKKFSKTEE